MPRKPKPPGADWPLPRGLFKHRRQYRARASHAHPFVYFGTDYAEALKGFGAWKAAGGKRDTVAWLLDVFTSIVCAGKVKAAQLAQRTADDYGHDAEVVKAGLGHIAITDLRPHHVVAFRDARGQDAPRHVHNELACLSAAMQYAVDIGQVDRNPCREVKRPRKAKRERLITHEEYLAVYARANASVQLAMMLAVRTLAIPADLLAMGPRNVARTDAGRVLRFQRGKTRRLVEVAIVGELAHAIDAALADKVVCSTSPSATRCRTVAWCALT